MPLNNLKRLLKSLPFYGSRDGYTGSCLINIRQMAAADVRCWNRHVQPLIKAQYDAWPASVPVDWFHPAGIDLGAIRADVDWDWERIFLLAKCHNYLRPFSNAREQAHAWCLELSGAAGEILDDRS